MKLKNIILALTLLGLLSACNDEDSIVTVDEELVPRFEFPQGTNEWDVIAEEINEKHHVYLIYKGYSALDFSRAWTVNSGKSYFGEALTDEKAEIHVKFMKNHIFDFLPEKLTQTVLPFYYFLVDAYRSETISTTSVSNDTISNFITGLDYWANSIYSAKVKTFPAGAEKLKEHRVRIMRHFFESAIGRGKIVIPTSFHDGFNYTTALSYSSTDSNYPLKRGFVGLISGDVYNFTLNYNLSYINPTLNFLTYVFLGIRYTEAEFLVVYPRETYPLIYKKRLEVINYLKDKYDVDLLAIAQGPEL